MGSLAEVLKRLGKLRGKRSLKIDVHAWLTIEHEQRLLVFIIFVVFPELVDEVCPEILLGLSILVLWSNGQRVSEDTLEGERTRGRSCGRRKKDGLRGRLRLTVWHQPGSICTACLHPEAGTGGEGWGEQVSSGLDWEGGQENTLLPLLQLLLHSLQGLVRYQAWLLLQHVGEERGSDLGVLQLQWL